MFSSMSLLIWKPDISAYFAGADCIGRFPSNSFQFSQRYFIQTLIDYIQIDVKVQRTMFDENSIS